MVRSGGGGRGLSFLPLQTTAAPKAEAVWALSPPPQKGFGIRDWFGSQLCPMLGDPQASRQTSEAVSSSSSKWKSRKAQGTGLWGASEAVCGTRAWDTSGLVRALCAGNVDGDGRSLSSAYCALPEICQV